MRIEFASILLLSTTLPVSRAQVRLPLDVRFFLNRTMRGDGGKEKAHAGMQISEHAEMSPSVGCICLRFPSSRRGGGLFGNPRGQRRHFIRTRRPLPFPSSFLRIDSINSLFANTLVNAFYSFLETRRRRRRRGQARQSSHASSRASVAGLTKGEPPRGHRPFPGHATHPSLVACDLPSNVFHTLPHPSKFELRVTVREFCT